MRLFLARNERSQQKKLQSLRAEHAFEASSLSHCRTLVSAPAPLILRSILPEAQA